MFLVQQTVSVVQAASVLAVMTTPAVSAPALVVMEPVAHVTRTNANVTKIAAAQESPELPLCLINLIIIHSYRGRSLFDCMLDMSLQLN